MSRDICEEVGQNFIDFAAEANANRAFPDARDGLKPGMRACLWEMYTKGYTSNKPHVKSAKIDGGVAALWWPHGTTALYETFARMSQPFTNNVPEVDFHGANGNVILGGDAIAADRYTEARLAEVTEKYMLDSVKKDAVDMIWNFSEDEQWPAVFPSVFPRLLVNGSQGIGVSIANVWLLHNLQETTDMIVEYLSTGVINNDSYFPDFPTGGIIVNKKELPAINKTGKGKVIVEAKYSISGKEINFTEFPYQVYIEPLVEEIKDAIEKDKVHGVKEVLNKSDKNNILLTVVCAASADPISILTELFDNTSLRSQYNANQVAIVGKTPKLLSLQELVDIYISHNLSCIKRAYQFDLVKAQERVEILEGLARALKGIDAVIAIIRKADSSAAAKQIMIEKAKLTERQADAILGMKLSRLAKLEESEILKELEEKKALVIQLERVVNSAEEQKAILISKLKSLAEEYGTSRKTQVIDKIIEKQATTKAKKIKEPEKDVICLSSDYAYLKRVPASKFRSSDTNILNDVCMSDRTVTIFTSLGKAYRIKAEKIKECLAADKGTAIGSLLNLDTANYESVVYMSAGELPADMCIFTKLGKVKRFDSSLVDGDTQNLRGMSYIKLQEEDSVLIVHRITLNVSNYCNIETLHNRFLQFQTDTLKTGGKTSSGQIAIKMDAGDEVRNVMWSHTASKDYPLGKVGGRGKIYLAS